MSDITISYKGADILEMSESGIKTLKTSGKYCEGDVILNYVRPSGGGSIKTFTKELTFDTTVRSGNIILASQQELFD